MNLFKNKQTFKITTSKKTKLSTAMCALVFLFSLSIHAQDSNKSQMYSVHEDQVKLTMIDQYKELSKELVSECKKHNIKGLKWLSATISNRYLYLSPINNMADLDNDPFIELKDKMGDEAFNDLFSRINKCLEKQGDYILSLEHDLSYMPEGFTQTPESKDFRKYFYLNVAPENIEKLEKVIKATKTLYAKNNSLVNYRIYRSGYGAMGNYFMIAIAEKDAEAFRKLGDQNNELLGESRQPIFEEGFEYISQLDVFSGSYNKDLSYSPKK